MGSAVMIPEELIKASAAEVSASLARARDMAVSEADDRWWDDWLVSVPEYNAEGVAIERFTVSPEDENLDLLRTVFNPQRPDRRIRQGTFTRLKVDDVLWMTDTPAEITDLFDVDEHMVDADSMLIVGLGLGLVVQRAIVHQGVKRIDVVDTSGRIIRAVGDHYQAMADAHGVELTIHHSGIHQWRAPRGSWWDVGWFDIWANIDADDLPEVKRLRDRFRSRLGWYGAWAQADRIGQARRVKSGKWAY